MHGHTRNAIMRRLEQGFFPSAVCREWNLEFIELAIICVTTGRYPSFQQAVKELRHKDAISKQEKRRH